MPRCVPQSQRPIYTSYVVDASVRATCGFALSVPHTHHAHNPSPQPFPSRTQRSWLTQTLTLPLEETPRRACASHYLEHYGSLLQYAYVTQLAAFPSLLGCGTTIYVHNIITYFLNRDIHTRHNDGHIHMIPSNPLSTYVDLDSRLLLHPDRI